MAKRINQLDERSPTLTDLMLVGDPLTGYSYKANISDVIAFISANIGTEKKRFNVGDSGYPGNGDDTWTDADFEDAIMLANRVFDRLVTPHLVLHSETGNPIALISLDDLQITDYSTNPPKISVSESEHQELVAEFREEYLEDLAAAGDFAFAAGLLFPAIPIVISNGLGVDIVKSYIDQI